MTADEGSRATIAPLSAPTDVPRTRSGVMSFSNNAWSIPTSTAPSTPPPPSTNAVVTAPAPRSGPDGGRGQLGVLGTHPGDHPVLDPEDDQRYQARGQVEDRE